MAIDTLTEEQRGISMGSLLGDLDGELAYTDLERSTPPTRQDWLKSAAQMRKLIRGFRDLSYLRDEDRRLHVFMTAAQRVDDKTSIGGPALPGVLLHEVGGYVDVLARLVKVKRKGDDGKTKTVRYLHTEDHNSDGVTYLGKNRLNLLGNGIWRPTIGDLIARWMATEEEN